MDVKSSDKKRIEELYQVLELPAGASAADVKKAYFTLVRKYSPEKNPEKFQELRSAYEALKDGPPEQVTETETSWIKWDHPVVGYLIQQADLQADDGRYQKAVSLLEDAEQIEPGNPVIQLLKARYLLRNGNVQLAAKSAEKVTQALLDNREAWMIVANGYMNRGWYKKALPGFQKSYDLGLRGAEFLVGYGMCLAQNGLEQEALELFDLAVQQEDWESGDAERILIRYERIMEYIPADTDRVSALLDRYDRYISRNHRKLRGQEYAVSPLGQLFFRRNQLLRDPRLKQRIEQSLLALRRQEVISDQEFRQYRGTLFFRAMEAERKGRLSPHWLELVRALIVQYDDDVISRLMTVRAELELLKDPQKLNHDIAILEVEYPSFCEECASFLNDAKHDRAKLEKKLTWEYEKRRRNMPPEMMDELLSPMPGTDTLMRQMSRKKTDWEDEKEWSGEPGDWFEKEDWDSSGPHRGWEPEEPFVRQQEKVGRNDPCPCGSGKKFKKCCMGKGIYD